MAKKSYPAAKRERLAAGLLGLPPAKPVPVDPQGRARPPVKVETPKQGA